MPETRVSDLLAGNVTVGTLRLKGQSKATGREGRLASLGLQAAIRLAGLSWEEGLLLLLDT